MKKFFLFTGIMTAFLMSCTKEKIEKSCEQCVQTCYRNPADTLGGTSPSFNQKLTVKEVVRVDWKGRENGETNYKVRLNRIQNGLYYSDSIGVVKTTDCYLEWMVPSMINGKTINSDCCWLSFEGEVNKSNFIGQIFSIRPASGLIAYNHPFIRWGVFYTPKT